MYCMTVIHYTYPFRELFKKKEKRKKRKDMFKYA